MKKILALSVSLLLGLPLMGDVIKIECVLQWSDVVFLDGLNTIPKEEPTQMQRIDLKIFDQRIGLPLAVYWQPKNSLPMDATYPFQTSADSWTPEARNYRVEGDALVLEYRSRSGGGISSPIGERIIIFLVR
jgi:hypothetical protein